MTAISHLESTKKFIFTIHDGEISYLFQLISHPQAFIITSNYQVIIYQLPSTIIIVPLFQNKL